MSIENQYSILNLDVSIDEGAPFDFVLTQEHLGWLLDERRLIEYSLG